MVHWSLAFAVLAFVAGLVAFGGVSGAAPGAIRAVFLVALALFVASLLVGRWRHRRDRF